jgi:hypothetical protein
MDGLLVSSLTNLGYALPELLACGIALAMLWTTAREGKPRRLGLIGIGLMLLGILLQLGLSLYQNWMIQSSYGGAGVDLTRLFGLLGIVRALIQCVSMGGLVLIAWGLCKATQSNAVAR